MVFTTDEILRLLLFYCSLVYVRHLRLEEGWCQVSKRYKFHRSCSRFYFFLYKCSFCQADGERIESLFVDCPLVCVVCCNLYISYRHVFYVFLISFFIYFLIFLVFFCVIFSCLVVFISFFVISVFCCDFVFCLWFLIKLFFLVL